MTKVRVLRNPEKFSSNPEIRDTGKHGRKARMFEKSRKITALWEKAAIKPSKVESAVNFAELSAFVKSRKPVEITRHGYHKGKTSIHTIHAKEKRRMGVRELVRV